MCVCVSRTGAYTVAPVTEGRTGSRALQISSGCPRVVYWGGGVLWDLVMHCAVSMLALATFAAFGDVSCACTPTPTCIYMCVCVFCLHVSPTRASLLSVCSIRPIETHTHTHTHTYTHTDVFRVSCSPPWVCFNADRHLPLGVRRMCLSVCVCVCVHVYVCVYRRPPLAVSSRQ